MVDQNFGRAASRLASKDPPGLREPAVIVNRDLAFFQEAVEDALSVTAAIKPWAARVCDSVVFLDAKRIVQFQKFVRNGSHQWPEAMAVHS